MPGTLKRPEAEKGYKKTPSSADLDRPHTLRARVRGLDCTASYQRHYEGGPGTSFSYMGVTYDDGRLIIVPEGFPFPPDSSGQLREIDEFFSDSLDALALLAVLPGYWGDGRGLLKNLYNLGEYLADVIEAVESHVGVLSGDLSRQRASFMSSMRDLPDRF
jgi:hypothetical protein